MSASNGCYEWSSSKSNIMSIEYTGNDKTKPCHEEALVKLNTNKEYPNKIWIVAKDKNTKDILKCEA